MAFLIVVGSVFTLFLLIFYYVITVKKFLNYDFDTKKEFLLYLIPFYGFWVEIKEDFLTGLIDSWKELK